MYPDLLAGGALEQGGTSKPVLARINIGDGRIQTAAEAGGFGIAGGWFPYAYVASIRTVYVVDTTTEKVEERNTEKVFDLDWMDGALYFASHGSMSGDCIFACDADSGRQLGETPYESVEGGVVAWHGEVYGAKGDSIVVFDAHTLRTRRAFRVSDYCNGPMAASPHGLFVLLGRYAGVEIPTVTEGAEIALIDPDGGREIRRLVVHTGDFESG